MTTAVEPRTDSRAQVVEETPRSTRKEARNVRERPSRNGTGTTWMGDFRRFADVGGRQERLCTHLSDGEEEVRDESHAREIYWRVVGEYQGKRKGQAGSVLTVGATSARMVPSASTTSTARSNRETIPASAVPTEVLKHLPPEVAQMIQGFMLAISGSAPKSVGGELVLGDAAKEHLRRKRVNAANGKGRISTCKTDETSFRSLIPYFGQNTRLQDITASHIDAYIAMRLSQDGWVKGTTISKATVRNELHALSNMYSVLIKRGEYTFVHPVKQVDKPVVDDDAAEYMQRRECAKMLDAAARLDEETCRAIDAIEFLHRARVASFVELQETRESLIAKAESLYPLALRGEGREKMYRHVEALLAVYLFTGARSSEARKLLIADVDWMRMEIIFQRRLKRVTSVRRVPMTTELARILRDHIAKLPSGTSLLFPNSDGKTLGGLQTIFPRVVERAGIGRHLTVHSCRHTYATAMLHTYAITPSGRAAQRSSFQVAKLLGHKHSKLVDDTYGHLMWDAGLMSEWSVDELRELPSTRLSVPGDKDCHHRA